MLMPACDGEVFLFGIFRFTAVVCSQSTENVHHPTSVKNIDSQLLESVATQYLYDSHEIKCEKNTFLKSVPDGLSLNSAVADPMAFLKTPT